MSFDFHHLQKPSIGFKSVQGALLYRLHVHISHISHIYRTKVKTAHPFCIHSAPILHPFCTAIIVGLAMRTVVEWANYSPNKRRIVNPAEA